MNAMIKSCAQMNHWQLLPMIAILSMDGLAGEIYKLSGPNGTTEFTDAPKANSVPYALGQIRRSETLLPANSITATGVNQTKRAAEGILASSRATTRSTTNTVKWHPGHYALVYMGTDLSTSPVLAEVVANSQLRGIQKRYSWLSLEPAKNQYDFSEIRKDLDLLRGKGKWLVVQVQTKSFSDTDNYVPGYLRTSAYGGGAFRMSGGGYNITLWNTALKDRFVALANALGKALNADSALEAVNLNESSVGAPANTPSNGYDEGKFIDNLILVDTALRNAFPNTTVIQYTNYPKSRLPDMIASFRTKGVGMGGPDVYLADSGLLSGVYSYYPGLAGIVPLGVAVQSDNYVARYQGGPVDPPPVASIYGFAKDSLKANYIFWLRRTASNDDPTNYWQRVLDMLASPAVPKELAGGLSKTCPTMFGACLE